MGLSWRRWACRRGSPPCRRCPRRRWSWRAIDRAYWSWTSLLRRLPFTLPAIVAPRRVISKREAEAPPEPNASKPVLGHSHVIIKERPYAESQEQSRRSVFRDPQGYLL